MIRGPLLLLHGRQRKKTKVISLAQAFEKDGTAITWKSLGDKAK